MTDFTIVDSNDNPIGAKQRQNKQYDDIYRVASLWLTDSTTGDVLLAQRKWAKKNNPGKWAAAVSGTLEPNETYESNIVKEIEEEIGLIAIDITIGPKVFIDDGKNKFFCQWFIGSVDKLAAHVKIQEEEVEAVKWVTTDWLVDDVTRNGREYVPNMAITLKTLGLA